MRSFILGLLLSAVLLLPRAQAQTHVEFNTTVGPLLIELYDTEKPITVSNFLHYVTAPFAKEVFFQRWIPNFVLQGGGWIVSDKYFIDPTNPTNYVWNQIIGNVITNEFGVGKRYTNSFGTIAMARISPFINSAVSTYFINLTNNAYLDGIDGGFTVFGKVVGNTNLLTIFNDPVGAHGIWTTNLNGFDTNGVPFPGAFNNFPSLHPGKVGYEDLIFIRPHVINTEIRATFDNQAKTVSFNTLSNYTHVLEVSTNLASGWKLVTFALGTGSKISITDNSTSSPFRIYRVRLE